MTNVGFTVITLLQVLESATSHSTAQNIGAELQQINPLAFPFVQRHVLSHMEDRDRQMPARRLFRGSTLPGWFVDKDHCFIQYCNHYEVLRNASCCSDDERNGQLCRKMPDCKVSDRQHVERCKFQTIAMFQNANDEAQAKRYDWTTTRIRHVFSSDCGGLSEEETMDHQKNGPIYFEPKAAWECNYPDGKCFDDHAMAAGLPHKVQNCVTAHLRDPHTAQFTIDLYCLDVHKHFSCDSNLSRESFDPFATCKTDQDIVNAKCYIGCSRGFPYEYCTFEFSGHFRNYAAIGECSLHAECRSPHLESNTIFCSRSQNKSQPLPNMSVGGSMTGSPQINGSSPPTTTQSVLSRTFGQILFDNLPTVVAITLFIVFCASTLSICFANARARSKAILPHTHEHTKVGLEFIGVSGAIQGETIQGADVIAKSAEFPLPEDKAKPEFQIFGSETCTV